MGGEILRIPFDLEGNVITDAPIPVGYIRRSINLGTDTTGDMHNGAESKLIKQSANMLAIPFWSANGSTFDAKSFAEMQAYLSGTDNLYFGWVKRDNTCYVRQSSQYSTLFVPTAPQKEVIEQAFPQGDCGGGFAP